ncbi:hypothetical protein BASA60_009301 [Batrachochytrium salamandrivorans]|nr:hypothetical protein BASA60_009301 [Batrachochytrium salamandrivorans]KAH9272795.1 hypothetical protein BASA83_004999 [Batrachochytrium salamandrivorans]
MEAPAVGQQSSNHSMVKPMVEPMAEPMVDLVIDPSPPSLPPAVVQALTEEQLQLLKQTWSLLLSAMAQADVDAQKILDAPAPAVAEPSKSSGWSMFRGMGGNSSVARPSTTQLDSAASVDPPSTATAMAADGSRPLVPAVSPPKVFPMLHELGMAMHGEHPDIYILRFIRARNWVPKDATAMLINMLKWRASFGVRQVLLEAEAPLYQPELRRCQAYFSGVDRDGRICCCVHVCRHVASDLKRDLSEKHVVMTMESVCMMVVQNQLKEDTVTIVVDLRGFGLQHQDAVATKFLLNTFQNYYPERLGKALILSAPWLFSGFWQIIKPWLDPVVQAKVNFISTQDLHQYIDPSQVVGVLGGDLPDYVYTVAPETEVTALANLRASISEASKEALWSEFKTSLDEFTEATLDWCKTVDAKGHSDRNAIAKKLQRAYEHLSPIIRTPSNYHRKGIQKDPAFKDIVTLV